MVANDSSEFEQLYREHVDGVLAYALARTSRELAIEAVESTFLVAWQRINDIPDTTRAWLIGVARRTLADQRRADNRREALGVRIIAMRAAELTERDPAEVIAERDEAIAALNGLPESDRELLRLIAWEGLSIGEASQALGCSKSALKVRLHRARRRFESTLADKDALVEPAENLAAIVRPFLTDQPLLAKETI